MSFGTRRRCDIQFSCTKSLSTLKNYRDLIEAEEATEILMSQYNVTNVAEAGGGELVLL